MYYLNFVRLRTVTKCGLGSKKNPDSLGTNFDPDPEHLVSTLCASVYTV